MLPYNQKQSKLGQDASSKLGRDASLKLLDLAACFNPTTPGGDEVSVTRLFKLVVA